MTNGLRTIWSRVVAMVRTDRLDREFDEELATHLELLIEEGRRRGLSDGDARREAILKLGGLQSIREVHREQRGVPVLDVLAQDLRYAIRMLWKSPAFTGIVTLSLALGIGANTALFSLVDGLLLRSLPVRDPDGLVQVQVVPAMSGGFKKPWLSFDRAVFDSVRANSRAFTGIVGFWRLDRPAIVIDGAAEPAREVEQVTGNFFQELGVTPIVGRAPEPSDSAAAVISEGWWRARFGGRAEVIGQTLTIDDRTYSIVGVAPSRFHGFMLENSADLWIASGGEPRDLMMIARLAPDRTAGHAEAEIQGLFRQALLERFQKFSSNQPIEIDLVPAGRGLSPMRSQYRGALLALMVLVTVVLLTTCTNVSNLLTLRNAARARELTVRAALGAGRSRLIRQYLVESTLLAVVGCAFGLVFADWGVSVMLGMLPLTTIPDNLAFHADARILGFAIGTAWLSALLFGLAPAWRATAVDLTTTLRSSQGSTQTKGTRRLGQWLVACQVALSVLLLVGAGLFVQTLRNLARQDIGFNADGLLQVSIDTRFAGYPGGQIGPVYRLLLERVAAVPGVRSVTGIRNPVMRGGFSRMAIPLPGLEPRSDEMWNSAEVGPSFFETMGIALVRGRTFTSADFERGHRLYVVNEAFARHYFPNDDPISQGIGIIGVVKDVKLAGMRTDLGPMMYELARNDTDRVNALEVRTAADPTAIAPSIREAVRSVNPRLFVGVRTMREDIERSIARERMVGTVSAFFSLLGLLLASIGIFGVASFTVGQRTNELGIRMALGAGRWSVIRESLRDTMLVFAAGLAAGTVAAVVAVRLTASLIADLLFGLTATAAANIVGAVLVMLVVALGACILPVRHAIRIDPLAAIRHE